MPETTIPKDLLKTCFTRIPEPVAKILSDARGRSREYINHAKPYLSRLDRQRIAEDFVQKEFTVGLDLARINLEWDICEKFTGCKRLTVRIQLNEENEQTISRMMRMHAVSRNVVISQAIWSATYNRMYGNFRR